MRHRRAGDLPLAEKSASVYQLLPRALSLLYGLEPQLASCRAWISRVLPGKNEGPGAKHTWVVFATNEHDASAYLQNLLHLLSPVEPPVSIAYINTALAPHDLHPIRPAHPGVQYVYR